MYLRQRWIIPASFYRGPRTMDDGEEAYILWSLSFSIPLTIAASLNSFFTENYLLFQWIGLEPLHSFSTFKPFQPTSTHSFQGAFHA